MLLVWQLIKMILQNKFKGFSNKKSCLHGMNVPLSNSTRMNATEWEKWKSERDSMERRSKTSRVAEAEQASNTQCVSEFMFTENHWSVVDVCFYSRSIYISSQFRALCVPSGESRNAVGRHPECCWSRWSASKAVLENDVESGAGFRGDRLSGPGPSPSWSRGARLRQQQASEWAASLLVSQLVQL